jgi:hypothetical protein
MKYLLVLITLTVGFSSLADVTFNNDREIECSKEMYNCPSYKGKKQPKRLRSCDDVKKVWSKCGVSDPHGLDRDRDRIPCEKLCNKG